MNGTTKGGRTQDDVFKPRKMGRGLKGPANSKSSGAYNKSDCYHGMSKGGNTAEKASKMYGKSGY